MTLRELIEEAKRLQRKSLTAMDAGDRETEINAQLEIASLLPELAGKAEEMAEHMVVLLEIFMKTHFYGCGQSSCKHHDCAALRWLRANGYGEEAS